MRIVWQSWMAHSAAASATSPVSRRDIHDFANLPAIQSVMEQAHRRVLGFQLISQEPSDEPLETSASAATVYHSPAGSTQPSHPVGVGQIPALPRPKFLSALTAFALGE
jgi:hypothetical protein